MLQCRACSKFIHPPRPICRFCLYTELAAREMSGRAPLYTWTVAEQAFHPFFADRVPYVYATVELVEQPGLRLITNVVDCPHERLRVDMRLQVTFNEIAPNFTLPMIRPLT